MSVAIQGRPPVEAETKLQSAPQRKRGDNQPIRSLKALIACYQAMLDEAIKVRAKGWQQAEAMKINLDLKSLEHRREYISKTKKSGDFSAWGQIGGGVAGIGAMALGGAAGARAQQGVFNGLSIGSQGSGSFSSVVQAGTQVQSNSLTAEAQEKQMWADHIGENAKTFAEQILEPEIQETQQCVSNFVQAAEQFNQELVRGMEAATSGLS